MYTYKQLRKYDIVILTNMLKREREYLKQCKKENDFYHERATIKMIEKLEKVIKEKTN